MAEGRRTIDELARHGLRPRLVVAAEDVEAPEVSPDGRVLRVESDVVARVADSRTPQGVVAVYERPAGCDSWPAGTDLAIVIDGLSDPGNVGTIVRAAGAFGAVVAVVTPGADPWSPKAVRAGAGAHAVVPILSGSWDDAAARCAEHGLALVGLDGSGGPFEPGAGRAWVVGNEAHGLSDDARSAVVGTQRIPVSGAVESLNAAMAASIVLATCRVAPSPSASRSPATESG